MRDDTLSGGFTNPPVQSAQAFRAAMTAMARPGTIQTIAGGTAPAPVSPAAAVLLLTLCDAETPIHLAGKHDSAPVRDWVAFHIGAPVVAAEAAHFALGRWEALLPLGRYRIGTPEYPDRSATLIVECDGFSPVRARLRGPGIRDAAHLDLPEVAAFARNAALFPLGLDFFLAAGAGIAALPRSTKVEAA